MLKVKPHAFIFWSLVSTPSCPSCTTWLHGVTRAWLAGFIVHINADGLLLLDGNLFESTDISFVLSLRAVHKMCLRYMYSKFCAHKESKLLIVFISRARWTLAQAHTWQKPVDSVQYLSFTIRFLRIRGNKWLCRVTTGTLTRQFAPLLWLIALNGNGSKYNTKR